MEATHFGDESGEALGSHTWPVFCIECGKEWGPGNQVGATAADGLWSLGLGEIDDKSPVDRLGDWLEMGEGATTYLIQKCENYCDFFFFLWDLDSFPIIFHKLPCVFFFILLHVFIHLQKSPLVHEGYIPRPQVLPETADSTEPYIYSVFSCMCIPVIKFNL